MAKICSKLVPIALLALLLLSGCRFYYSFSPRDSRAAKAEKLREEGKCDEAIEEYQAHIQVRLKEPTRPEEENPYFYYLLIGDCHLQMGDVKQATRDYVTAKDEGVRPALVNERLRRLGNWYEAQKRYEEAIEHLQEFRELDTLMFDLDIDRIHKAQVRSEQQSEAEKTETATDSEPQ